MWSIEGVITTIKKKKIECGRKSWITLVWLLYSTIGPENTEFSLAPEGISFPRIGYFNYFGFDFTKLGQKAPDTLRNLL